MAGYSKRSLADKLGIKSGQKIHIANSPENYRKLLGKLPDKAVVARSLEGPCDFIQFFTSQRTELEAAFPELKKHLAPAGMLWISWPKGASKIKTSVNENVAREIGLQNGLVDVKVCAVDDVWSGLKFVFRLKDRKSSA
jgi:hypothetical protein